MGLEILDVLSTGLRCSLKRSLSRRLILNLCIVWSSGCIVSYKMSLASFAVLLFCKLVLASKFTYNLK